MARVWSMCLGTGRVQGGWPLGAPRFLVLAEETRRPQGPSSLDSSGAQAHRPDPRHPRPQGVSSLPVSRTASMARAQSTLARRHCAVPENGGDLLRSPTSLVPRLPPPRGASRPRRDARFLYRAGGQIHRGLPALWRWYLLSQRAKDFRRPFWFVDGARFSGRI